MESAVVTELEKRATASENAINELKQKIMTGGSDAALEGKLRQLLHLMQEDRLECESIRAQRDEMKEENERLRAQVAKHEYRIKHLLRTVDEIEAKSS